MRQLRDVSSRRTFYICSLAWLTFDRIAPVLQKNITQLGSKRLHVFSAKTPSTDGVRLERRGAVWPTQHFADRPFPIAKFLELSSWTESEPVQQSLLSWAIDSLTSKFHQILSPNSTL